MKNFLIFTFVLSLTIPYTIEAKGVYQKPEDFLNETFQGNVPKPRIVWLTGDVGKEVKKILKHKPASLRIRYWLQDKRGAWILEEIGKEKPITVGIVVDDNKIERVKVLVFRESRGWEIRRPFFTDQFIGVQLTPGNVLNKEIDNISGASLSVRATKKMSTLALFLQKVVLESHVAP